MLADGEYARNIVNHDDRFVDYYGTIQSIVTSSAQNDSGVFEVNINDERLLPFEGSGAESTLRLELPNGLRQFDYNTIADVILHVRYTARQAGDQVKTQAPNFIKEMIEGANTTGLVRMFILRHNFNTEWNRFTTTADSNFFATSKEDHIPYLDQGLNIDNLSFQIFIARECFGAFAID